MSEDRLLITAPNASNRWRGVLKDARVVLSTETDAASDVILLDGETTDAVERLRELRKRLPHTHAIIVAGEQDHARIRRQILLTPGIGETWVVQSDQLTPDLLAEAGRITVQRRAFATRTKRPAHSAQQPPPERTPVVTDALLAAVLQVARVGVITLDPQLRILSLNPGAETMLSTTEAAALGHSVKSVLNTPEDLDFHALERQKSPARLSVTTAAGVKFFELTVASVKRDNMTLTVAVLHDVTEATRHLELLEHQAFELEHQSEELGNQAEQLELLLQERDEALADVQNLMAARSRFYAAMNHEIRTPINAILGFNDLMLTGVYGQLDPAILKSVERSQRAARHLLELVNDVLDLSKIEAGRVEMDFELHNLNKLISELVQTMEPTVAEYGSRISCDLSCDIEVKTDGRRLRQILLNLLSNAAKFGRGKPIEVRCAQLESELRIDITDHGVGIAPEQVEKIFDEFVQLRERRGDGTGLGLAISRKLSDLLGGRIEVKSELGQGSTFSIVLPRHAGAQRPGLSPNTAPQ